MLDVNDFPKSKIQAAEEAVRLALANRWEEALAVNDDLVERFGPDEETSNRRGKALLELGRLEEALAAYEETLGLNPENHIAQRQAAKLRELSEAKAPVAPVSASVDVNLFTDEPGKSALTRLALAPGVDPAAVAPGDPLDLELGDEVKVRTTRGVELGAVEPRLAQRILDLSKRGNRYSGAVTHVDGGAVQLILREVYQAPELAGTNSFPVHKGRDASYRPYAKEPVPSREDGSGLDEEEDSLDAGPAGSDELEEGFSGFEETPEEAAAEEADEDLRPEDEY